MSTQLVGASEWEKQIYAHLVEHVDTEQDIIRRYRDVADRSGSPAFQYLARLIIEDEQRHHSLMLELAQSLKSYAEHVGGPEPVPLPSRPSDTAELLGITKELLEVEKADRRELGRLAKEFKDVGTTTLWRLMITLMERDTDKHIEMLEFARKWLT